ncbi:MAG: hypothetical protein LUI60_02525 [Clostridia bacterium]|nr:hypothetical protein [Clostridia bacterium]
MKNKIKKPLLADREIMTEAERELLIRDLTTVAEEYFEPDGKAHLDITRTESGLSVCLIFSARRIKKLWRPQN